MRAIVTGAAGFIGMHAAEQLARDGYEVIGVDNFNDYYPVALKRARAARIAPFCPILEMDIAGADALKAAFLDFAPDVVVHLAAQAGVRYSLENPFAYVQSNLAGHVSVLEACRALGDRLSHLVYASSSSVYGGNTKVPFSETDPVELPVSLYAATKRADELISSAYAHLYDIRQIGLRFFTVYGPWGRPDMAYWLFTEKMLKGEPIPVFNHGDMRRDFTWIGDIVSGLAAIAKRAPDFQPGERPHKVYNIGNNRPEPLLDMIAVLERALGLESVRDFRDMQPGDVRETYADIAAITRDYGFSPSTPLSEGLPKFVSWYREHYA